MRLPRLAREERILLALFLLTLPMVNPYLRGDGNGYYAYLRSCVIDGDLQFDNDYRRADPDFVSASFRRADGEPWPPMRMPTGHLRNQWSVGPSLLWAPAFLEAHAAVLGLRALGRDIPADGYSRPYLWACALATAFYSFVGLLLCYRIAARFTAPQPALAATLALWLASSLPMYMYFLPFYAHAPSAFAVALFLGYWLANRPLRRAGQWALWGACGGLMAIVYHLNAVVWLAALAEWTREVRARARTPAPGARGEALRAAAAFAGGALLVALPHFAAKWIVQGSPFDTGRLNRFFWDAPRLWEVGFASEHGLFLWTPLVLLALAGLVRLARRDAFVAGTLLACFAAFYYSVAAYDRWHGVSGFGNRFFISLTAIFVAGLAVLIEEAVARMRRRLRPRPAWGVLAAGLALFVAWNAGLMLQWATGMIARRGPVDFAQVARQQFREVPAQLWSVAGRYFAAREQMVDEHERRSVN